MTITVKVGVYVHSRNVIMVLYSGVKSSSSSQYEIKNHQIISSVSLLSLYSHQSGNSGFPPCLLVVGGAALPLAGVVHPRCADRTGDEVGGARGHEVSHCRWDVHPLVRHQVICCHGESFVVRTVEQSNGLFESGWGMYRSHRPLNKHTDPESAAHMED